MPQQFSSPSFDADRAHLLLRDLRERTRGNMPIVRFEQATAPSSLLREVTSRSGLFRLGVDLASAALEEEGQVIISNDGNVAADGSDAVIQFVFVDEPGSRS